METLKITGLVLSLIGTLILAYRITSILSAVSLAVQAHDLNFQITATIASGDRTIPNIQVHGADKHVLQAEKFGKKLLIIGFALQIIGGICQVASLLVAT
jgi:hypothetical protein